MLRRALSVLLCGCLLAGSLPEISFAAEVPAAESSAVEMETEEISEQFSEKEIVEAPDTGGVY